MNEEFSGQLSDFRPNPDDVPSSEEISLAFAKWRTEAGLPPKDTLHPIYCYTCRTFGGYHETDCANRNVRIEA